MIDGIGTIVVAHPFLLGMLHRHVIEHTLGTEVVAFLHHLLQYFFNRTLQGEQRSYHAQRITFRTIGKSSSLRLDALRLQTVDKGMEEEILGIIDAQGTGRFLGYIARYMNQITIVQPVAGDSQTSGFRLMTHAIVIHLIEIRSRHTLDCRKRVLRSRNDRYIHTSPIEHQRRHVWLERSRHIVPRPTASPIY